MQSEEHVLPPAAVQGWYLLALAVFRGVTNQREREAWVTWAAMRQAIREMNQSHYKAEGVTQGARRMGHFEGAAGPARNKKFTR